MKLKDLPAVNRYPNMRSWVLSIIGIVGLVGALSVSATGQGGATTPTVRQGVITPAPVDQKPFKEQRFRLEWTVKVLSGSASNSPESEAVTISSGDGQTAMTTNPVPAEDKFRRVTLHSEQQTDGSFLINVGVSEFTKDQDRDIPRIDTIVKAKLGETKIVQDRITTGTNYKYQYQFKITPEIE